MTTSCEHTPGGACCNRADLACPTHFTQLVAAFMEGVSTGGDRQATAAAAKDLSRHAWIVPAMWTWCAIIQAYARQPGESRDDLLARINTDTQPLTPQDRAERGGWVFRLGVITRAAVCGDGAMIEDTMATILSDPYMTPARTMSMVASLAHATHHVVTGDPRITAQTVATYAILGSQTLTATGFSMLHPMADLAEAFRLGQVERPEVTARFADLDAPRLLSGVAIAGRALGQLVDPHDPVLVGTTGIGATAAANITGVMEWRDAALDGDRLPQELVAARAMRVAVAFATGRRQQVVELLRSSDDDFRYALDVIIGCCTIIAMMVASSDVTA